MSPLLRRSIRTGSVWSRSLGCSQFASLQLQKQSTNRVTTRPFSMAATIPTKNSTSAAASADRQIRTESDAFGKIEVDSSRYWGAQTQRSLENFPIGGRESRMPIEVVKGAGIFGAPTTVSQREPVQTGCSLHDTSDIIIQRFSVFLRDRVTVWCSAYVTK